MIAKDLLNDDERNILRQAYTSAIEVNRLVRKMVDNGFPYNEHLAKSDEQLAFLQRTMDVFEVER